MSEKIEEELIVKRVDLELLFDYFAYDELETNECFDVIKKYKKIKEKYKL